MTNRALTSISLCLALTLTGCGVTKTLTGTVTPDAVVASSEHSKIPIDSSTPSQYDPQNGGKIWSNRNAKGTVVSAVITYNAVQRYNYWITKYRIQFKELRGVDLSPNDGITPFVDQYGNNLFLITAEHYGYFGELASINRAKTKADGIVDKIKDKLSPETEPPPQ